MAHRVQGPGYHRDDERPQRHHDRRQRTRVRDRIRVTYTTGRAISGPGRRGAAAAAQRPGPLDARPRRSGCAGRRRGPGDRFPARHGCRRGIERQLDARCRLGLHLPRRTPLGSHLGSSGPDQRARSEHRAVGAGLRRRRPRRVGPGRYQEDVGESPALRARRHVRVESGCGRLRQRGCDRRRHLPCVGPGPPTMATVTTRTTPRASRAPSPARRPRRRSGW